MNKLALSFLALGIIGLSCTQASSVMSSVKETITESISKASSKIDTNGTTIQTRFIAPDGFSRISVANNSFGAHLRQLPLKPQGSLVKHFDGTTKQNYEVYEAVVDLPIGKRNLHQCADAVMRLKADHLYQTKQFDKIHFNFTNGFRVDYKEWMKGRRVVIKGNKTYWNNRNAPSNTQKDYWKYMELIFSYAGTLSLNKELKPVDVKNMKIGDVFIQGGSPGHAIIVVDMVKNESTGKTKFLLAQSYMPAQEIQILKNPKNNDSPWYDLEFGDVLNTPEWTFYKSVYW